MKVLVFALALAVPAAATAQSAARVAAPAERGFHERLYERYCEKLREGPEAYVQFVKRLRPIHGYSFEEFAPAQPGDPVRADCRASRERVAAVHALLEGK